MHGLINRSIQVFLTESCGAAEWRVIAAQAGLGFDNFVSMLSYDPALTFATLDAAETRLSKPRAMLLEDLGTWLVSNPRVARLRRLLRFGGTGFVEFLHSLDELPERGRLAVPDLDLPALELTDHGCGLFSLLVSHDVPGFGHVLVGILRAMADEYGALVCLEHRGATPGAEVVGIEVVETHFAAARDFSLAVPLP
jgi:hypothetical protein